MVSKPESSVKNKRKKIKKKRRERKNVGNLHSSAINLQKLQTPNSNREAWCNEISFQSFQGSMEQTQTLRNFFSIVTTRVKIFYARRELIPFPARTFGRRTMLRAVVEGINKFYVIFSFQLLKCNLHKTMVGQPAQQKSHSDRKQLTDADQKLQNIVI